MELLEYTGMKDYTKNLEQGKQIPYSSFYSLSSKKLETLKSHIKSYLKTGLI